MEQRYRAVPSGPVRSHCDGSGRHVRGISSRGARVALLVPEPRSSVADNGSHRPREHLWQIDPAVEPAIWEMRRDHPRWVQRRLALSWAGRAAQADPLPVAGATQLHPSTKPPTTVTTPRPKSPAGDYPASTKPGAVQARRGPSLGRGRMRAPGPGLGPVATDWFDSTRWARLGRQR